MRLSKMQVLPAALSCLLLFSACDSFFSTSVASWLARDIDYSSLSLDELLTLAATRGATSSDEAKKILAALANFSEDELLSLSAEQKESILATAINATLDLNAVLSLTDTITDGDTSDILDQIYDLANSDVDMTAVSIILQDEDTLATADVDTIILAGAAYVISEADNVEDIDTSMASDVVDALKERDEEELANSMFGDYLDDILGSS